MSTTLSWTDGAAFLVGARPINDGYRWARWRVQPWWLVPPFIVFWVLVAFAITKASGQGAWEDHSDWIVAASLAAVWVVFTGLGWPPRTERERMKVDRKAEDARVRERQHRAAHPEEYCTHIWESYAGYSSDTDGDAVFKRCSKCRFIVAVHGHNAYGTRFTNPLPTRGTGTQR